MSVTRTPTRFSPGLRPLCGSESLRTRVALNPPTQVSGSLTPLLVTFLPFFLSVFSFLRVYPPVPPPLRLGLRVGRGFRCPVFPHPVSLRGGVPTPSSYVRLELLVSGRVHVEGFVRPYKGDKLRGCRQFQLYNTSILSKNRVFKGQGYFPVST